MWDENSIFARIETGYAYTADMNDELVEKFNTGNFTQGTALLKIKSYNPKNKSFNISLLKKEKRKLKVIE